MVGLSGGLVQGLHLENPKLTALFVISEKSLSGYFVFVGLGLLN